MIPYGKQTIGDDDFAAVAEVLRSDWLTTGPKVAEFERAVAEFCGVEHGVAISNGTAALHAAMAAIGIGPGDEVIVPALTFVASANGVVYQGGTPVFADVDPETLLVDPASVAEKMTPRTRAVVAVDYAGQPCDYDALQALAGQRGIPLVADACHSLGASYGDRMAGALADLSAFSFHPVKPVTTGEGGMIVTSDAELARRMRVFRNHGITTDFRQRESVGSWDYDMVSLGYNLRLSDLSCALGISQLRKLPEWIERRNRIATEYHKAFAGSEKIRPLAAAADRTHGYHLFVVRVSCDRNEVFKKLRAAGIGVNVHYKPVYLHPFYRNKGYPEGLCPMAEKVFDSILSLPIYPRMTDAEIREVVAGISEAVATTA
ncbi:MAG: UDP-4-amino-4,6-dideoxy-N-acetyl-beta-L-altrosamine transaminase [Terrimicrobiaceae bacterium]